MQDKKNIQSISKAINLLDILSNEKRPLSLNDLHERTKIPKSTLHGLLSTMRDHSIITQNNDGKYFLGIRLFEYGCAVSSTWDICEISRPYLQQLSNVTGETSMLSIEYKEEILTLEQSQGRSELRIVSDIGVRLPMHCTSQGKLFLAYMPNSASRKFIKSDNLIAYTPHTIISSEALQNELEQIRNNGYSIENGEFKIGLRSVSAPVFDSNNNILCAICVVGMFRKVDSDEFRLAIKSVTEAATAISNIIGYNGKGHTNII
ncbi:MAG: IclR family transcriptional regulator [Acutalibacteraceae bacterium]